MQDHIKFVGKGCCVGPNLCLYSSGSEGAEGAGRTISKQEEAAGERKPPANPISLPQWPWPVDFSLGEP